MARLVVADAAWQVDPTGAARVCQEAPYQDWNQEGRHHRCY